MTPRGGGPLPQPKVGKSRFFRYGLPEEALCRSSCSVLVRGGVAGEKGGTYSNTKFVPQHFYLIFALTLVRFFPNQSIGLGVIFVKTFIKPYKGRGLGGIRYIKPRFFDRRNIYQKNFSKQISFGLLYFLFC